MPKRLNKKREVLHDLVPKSVLNGCVGVKRYPSLPVSTYSSAPIAGAHARRGEALKSYGTGSYKFKLKGGTPFFALSNVPYRQTN